MTQPPNSQPPNSQPPDSQPPNSQPPSDQPHGDRSPGDQPQYGQPGYGQPGYGQQSGAPQYGAPPQYGQPSGWGEPTAAQYGADVRQTEAGYAQMYGQKQKTGMSVAALVLGILAIILAWFPIGSYIAVVLALLALIFGIVGVRRRAGKGMAVTGIVLGALALVASVIMSIIWTLGFIAVSECFDETGATSGPAFEDCIDRKAREF